MFIGEYPLHHNRRPPYYVISYLRQRYRSLYGSLERQGNKKGFSVDLDFSNQSEACYLTIATADERILEISIRNHDNFAGSMYDVPVYLSRFKSWKQCRSFIVRRLVPAFLSNLSVMDVMDEFYREKREDEQEQEKQARLETVLSV